MKKIRILGKAAEIYGDTFDMNVHSQADAINGLDCNFPGFTKYLDDNKYILALIDESDPEGAEQTDYENYMVPWKNETLFILPTTEGEITGIVVGAVAGSVYAATTAGVISSIAAGIVTGTVLGVAVSTIIATVINIAISVAISAIVSLITGALDNGGKEADEESNYLFTGAINGSKQGSRMPLLYGGPMMCGSIILSGRIMTNEDPEEDYNSLLQLWADTHPDWSLPQ